ncbi:metal-dependent transcriptional regulator [Mucisphaera calidilacus]|uniref:Transcriptional regulator MntR n=1 Tax=Mucisphaera calidilacus TaxID=2527982 RepID=A0A518C008_9BACT|nr:metal-dependent transcriptional regulator [Mucisphaera calidilacus]QDU72555.1 Iron-dependent repressor IdeR [Mucisphaera calidilacus]
MPTSTVENYLKAIHGLGQSAGGRVSTGALAERLSVTPGTVTTMVKQLAERRLIDYRPREGVRLTRSGRAVAVDVLRRHRLIELFLVEVMQLDWSEVHAEAEALEHVISERMLERMDDMLGRPTRDPHGDPIPTAAGDLPMRALSPLSDAGEGVHVLGQIVGDDPAYLTWLADHGLHPGARVAVVGRDAFAGTIRVRVGGDASGFDIGLTTAARLMVESGVRQGALAEVTPERSTSGVDASLL